MNDNAEKTITLLPLPPSLNGRADDMELYARFMRHLRNVPNSRLEILVDLGLRAPRMAFPAEFLRFIDRSLMRSGWEIGGPSAAVLELKSHWDKIGEDKFAAVKGEYPLETLAGALI